MGRYHMYVSLGLTCLILGQAFSLPQHQQLTEQQIQAATRDRKFSEKPNAMKKVVIDDIDDLNANTIQEGSNTGFSWGNMLGILMQMLLGPSNGASPSKNDIDDNVQPSPWSNLISMGLKVLTAILGGIQQPSDGIDKVDNQASGPMQFINIVINLLDALKTSFSHRSMQARSLGKKDSVSDAASAFITMFKGYMKSLKSFNNVGRAKNDDQHECAQRLICEASAECTADSQGTSTVFCQLGSYATSYFIQKQSGVNFEMLYEAGKRGRFGEDCRTIFVNCNDI